MQDKNGGVISVSYFPDPEGTGFAHCASRLGVRNA
jgi:hypothetical protein